MNRKHLLIVLRSFYNIFFVCDCENIHHVRELHPLQVQVCTVYANVCLCTFQTCTLRQALITDIMLFVRCALGGIESFGQRYCCVLLSGPRIHTHTYSTQHNRIRFSVRIALDSRAPAHIAINGRTQANKKKYFINCERQCAAETGPNK